MKKFNLKEALFAGTGFTVLYTVIRLWQSDDYSFSAIGKMVITGLIIGVIFGLIMGFFYVQKQVTKIKIDLHKCGKIDNSILCLFPRN